MPIEEDPHNPKPVFWPGPWHFVVAKLPKGPQVWGVNHVPTRVEDGEIVAFMLTDDALHFVETDRAEDLGVWQTFEDLKEAIDFQRKQDGLPTLDEAAQAAAEEAEQPKKAASVPAAGAAKKGKREKVKA
jgi:hypothetical protein